MAIQNPLRVDWIIPDCVCSGDIMFVPLTLSNCGLEVLDVELTCVIKGATFQISRLLLEGNEMVKEAGGVIGTVTVPCGGATYCMEIQVETLAHCAQAATISVTATVWLRYPTIMVMPCIRAVLCCRLDSILTPLILQYQYYQLIYGNSVSGLVGWRKEI